MDKSWSTIGTKRIMGVVTNRPLLSISFIWRYLDPRYVLIHAIAIFGLLFEAMAPGVGRAQWIATIENRRCPLPWMRCGWE